MYLTVHNQLTLLHDLLDEQIVYQTVSTNEYRQIKRLIQSMIVNDQIDNNLSAILPEIYYFSIRGETAHSYKDHINENLTNIRSWISTINETKQNQNLKTK